MFRWLRTMLFTVQSVTRSFCFTRNFLPIVKFERKPFFQSLKISQLRHFGVGNHASQRSNIDGSIQLYALTGLNQLVLVHRLLFEGLLQWILGRNITRLCNVVHKVKHELRINRSKPDVMWIIECNHQLHVSLKMFIPSLSCSHSQNLSSVSPSGQSKIWLSFLSANTET